MRDDDTLLADAQPEFGSGVVGVCNVCGTRQAVIVLQKERFRLCVIDFLNKAWLKTDQKAGAPIPLYHSERIWFDTDAVPGRRAPAVVLSPTKVARHPTVLITPDVYGLTTTVLDAAIRFAKEGYEVMLPDVTKTSGIGLGHHVAIHLGGRLRGGVPTRSRKVGSILGLYRDALEHLRAREMVDPAKSALFGGSYGGALALALAAQDHRLAAVVLAYPMPVRPIELPRLLSAPVLYVGGTADRAARSARHQLEAYRSPASPAFEYLEVPGARHDFLSRDASAYDLGKAEASWTRILAFLRKQLLPPPPRPPAAVPPRPPAPIVTSPPVLPTLPPSAPSAPPLPGPSTPASAP